MTDKMRAALYDVLAEWKRFLDYSHPIQVPPAFRTAMARLILVAAVEPLSESPPAAVCEHGAAYGDPCSACQTSAEDERGGRVRRCAWCGSKINGYGVIEKGLETALDAEYHGHCFEKKELRMKSGGTFERKDAEPEPEID